MSDDVDRTSPSVRARLDAATRTQGRIRFALGAMAVVSMMMAIASYNAYLSYDSYWVETVSREFTATRRAADIVTEQALRNWVDSRTVLVSLLGIRLNVDDAPVLGTFSLLLLGMWLVLVTRSENHTVGLLLHDTVPRQATSLEQQRLIVHTIEANSVFLNLSDSLSSIRSLDAVAHDATPRRASRLNALLSKSTEAFFFFFPVIVSLIVFLVDRWSYFIVSPFNPTAGIPGTVDRFYRTSFVGFIVFWLCLLATCSVAWRYSIATQTVLRSYRERLSQAVTPDPGAHP